MRIIETKIYTFAELSKEAQEKAIEWHKENNTNDCWYENDKDEFEAFLAAIGFDNVNSQFSGFWSQGDGASFDFKRIDINKLATPHISHVTAYDELHAAFLTANKDLLRKVTRFHDSIHYYSTTNSYATHYCHARTRGVSYELITTYAITSLNKVEKAAEDLRAEIDSFCEALSNAYYEYLEASYNDEHSDERAIEFLTDNEHYEFNENGEAE